MGIQERTVTVLEIYNLRIRNCVFDIDDAFGLHMIQEHRSEHNKHAKNGGASGHIRTGSGSGFVSSFSNEHVKQS